MKLQVFDGKMCKVNCLQINIHLLYILNDISTTINGALFLEIEMGRFDID